MLSLVKKIWSGRDADSSNYDYGGHNAYNYEYGGHKVYDYGGHPAPAGRALPNLINAVKMLKTKSKPRCGVDFDVDFNILTA